MNLKKRILSAFLVAVLLLSGCTKFTLPTNADAAFEQFTLELFKQDVSTTTLGLHYTLQDPSAYGITPGEPSFGEFPTDPSALLASLENCRNKLDKFSYGLLSKQNKLTYQVLSSYISTTMEGAKYILHEEPLSPTTGIHAQLPMLLAEYPLQNTTHIETYLSLLETLPEYFASLSAFEKAKAEAGLFMSDVILEEVLTQCEGFVAMGDSNYLLSTFEERLASISELNAQQKTDYIAKNKSLLDSAVLPAYTQLIEALSNLRGSGRNTQGLCYLPEGKAYYEHLAAKETGSTRSISEMEALIERQIADDILSMQKIASEYPTLLEQASAGGSLDASAPERILSDLEKKIGNTFPKSQDVNIEIKYVPPALESYLSPAFYFIPAIDNTIENVIYINRGNSPEGLQLFTTLAHEGYPGHLYQTTYYAASEPNPLRMLFNFKGYVEGWATYAEMCSYYLAPIEKPYATLLQKNSSFILGLYALADIGIHEHGWNLERSIEFFRNYGIEDEEIIAEIYELILGDPANYLAYYVGYLEFLELKKECIAKQDEDFSQKKFHKAVLEVGPAPFSIVRKAVLGA
ncbi:MAG: DUF885 domain-containing protein [Faecalimonas sp.]|nr:DUF885 domain-containing protein [Faecalimonas sp.]